MVYISFPSEYGTIYSRDEIARLYAACQQYGLQLYIDGARLGYALASPANDVTLPWLAAHCDAFYIGGTKVGALCGEAVVFPRGNAPKNFSPSSSVMERYWPKVGWWVCSLMRSSPTTSISTFPPMPSAWLCS